MLAFLLFWGTTSRYPAPERSIRSVGGHRSGRRLTPPPREASAATASRAAARARATGPHATRAGSPRAGSARVSLRLGSLVGGNLLAHDLLGQHRNLLLEEVRHALLLAAVLPGELRGLLVAELLRERF